MEMQRTLQGRPVYPDSTIKTPSSSVPGAALKRTNEMQDRNPCFNVPKGLKQTESAKTTVVP
jgi:hypothetical protein